MRRFNCAISGRAESGSVPMRLANIEADGLVKVALVLEDDVVDLTAHVGLQCNDVPKFLAMGTDAHTLAERWVREGRTRLPLKALKLCSPVKSADKIIGVGMNYHSCVNAARQIGVPVPPQRLWFMRPSSCLAGPHDDILLPQGSNELDYEAELAVVIGRRCRNVTVTEARSVIGGFAAANDLTLRERVLESPVLGKSFETHTPLGPWIVTPDEIGDPHSLALRAWVNGVLRQQSNTAEMIGNCYELIAELTASFTLNPGDVILTGTPSGSGIFHRPPVTLAAGDLVQVQIEGIGMIENRVVDEPLHA